MSHDFIHIFGLSLSVHETSHLYALYYSAEMIALYPQMHHMVWRMDYEYQEKYIYV